VAFEFLKSELKHVFAATDFVISRAGANAIFEFLALKKPMLLIPLESGSRGDQVQNADDFRQNNFAIVLREGDLNGDSLLTSISELEKNAEKFRENMLRVDNLASGQRIVAELESVLKR